MDDFYLASYSNNQPPTLQPTVQPTLQPSPNPTSQPTSQPSGDPTCQPVEHPTSNPSVQPTGKPSQQPYVLPSSDPSLEPTSQPTSAPSITPDKTVCQLRTFVGVNNQARFTRHHCVVVPHSSQHTSRRRTSSSISSSVTSASTDLLPASHRNFKCSAFSVTDTALASNANADYSCQFTACPGDHVRVSMRSVDGGICKGMNCFNAPLLCVFMFIILFHILFLSFLLLGDAAIRLINGVDVLHLFFATIKITDEFNLGYCPMMEYVFSDNSKCQQYTAVQGCMGSSPCSGLTTIQFLPSEK